MKVCEEKILLSELEQLSIGNESNLQRGFYILISRNRLTDLEFPWPSEAFYARTIARKTLSAAAVHEESRVNGCQEFHGGNVVSGAAIPPSPAISRASVHPSRSITDKARFGTFRSVAASKICVRRRGMKRCIFRPVEGRGGADAARNLPRGRRRKRRRRYRCLKKTQRHKDESTGEGEERPERGRTVRITRANGWDA